MKKHIHSFLALGILLLATSGQAAMAGVGAKAIGEAAEYVMKTFSREAAEQGAESITRQITKIAAEYGDDGIVAVRKLGPRGMQLIEKAGKNGLDAVKLINRYGDDAVWVISKPKGMAIFVTYGDDGAKALIRHKGIAEEVIEAHGTTGVRALNAVGTREARQIAMLQKDGVIKVGEQGDELLDVIARYGDKAMAFVWRNKGALAVTAGLGTFIANPEAYIDGGKELIVEGVSRPATEIGKEVARHTNWTVLGIAGIGALGALAAWRTWVRKPAKNQA